MQRQVSDAELHAQMEAVYQAMNAQMDELARKVFTPDDYQELAGTYRERTKSLEQQFARMDAEIAKMRVDRHWTTWFCWAMFWISGFLCRGLFS